MTNKPESRLQRRIRREIEKRYSCWGFKVWGGPFQPAGIPDLLFCVEGLFVALEVKRPGEVSSKVQELTIRKIRRAGGVASVVESVEEALKVVESARSAPAKDR